MEIALPRGGGDPEDTQFAKVTKRLRDAEGRPVGTVNDNPLLDTRDTYFHRLMKRVIDIFCWTTLLTFEEMEMRSTRRMCL